MNPKVLIQTSRGDITVELYADKAPISVDNFLRYAEDEHFDGLIFHRVIAGFMIQCGGLDADFTQRKTRAPIKNEADNGLKNERGTLSMARTNQVDSATSQFFINLKDNDFLDHQPRNFGYAVFGRVTDGLQVVDDIAKVRTGRIKGYDDAPTETITIESVRRIDADKR